MAKPKKSYVPNVATVKISNPAWHIFVPRSTTPSLPSRILTEMQFPGQAPAAKDLKVPVSPLHSQRKWRLNQQLKQLWSTA